MRLYIALAVFVCRWWMVYGIGRCPFPGITAHTKFVNSSINWENRRSFQEGDVVEYKCDFLNLLAIFYSINHQLACRSDGTWDNPIPRCGLILSKGSGTLAVEYGLNPSKPWTGYHSCSSNFNQRSNIYSLKIPTEFKYLKHLVIASCEGGNYFNNSTLDQVKGCTLDLKGLHPSINYDCNDVSLNEIQHSITIHMKENIPLDDISVVVNRGNHCGWPPVPVHADVAIDVIPGNTTNVTYRCNDRLVIDPNGPQFSTCDQLTGQWTALPKCICADPPVPANAQIVSRTDFSVQYQCDFPFHLNGFSTVVCDDTGIWGQLPSCKRVLGHSPILAVAVIAFLLLIVVLLLILILKIKQMCCFKQTKSSLAVSNGMNPDRRGLRQSTLYEPPGWPIVTQQPTSREEPIYQRIDAEKDWRKK